MQKPNHGARDAIPPPDLSALSYATVRSYIAASERHVWSLRVLGSLLASRTTLYAIIVHTVATLLIVSHFFLIKWAETLEKTPLNAPFYWFERTIPAVEFGAMHSTLFQLALLPITMSRHLITATGIGNTAAAHFVHLHLGYACTLTIIAGGLQLTAFFGLICQAGQEGFQAHCDRFVSESNRLNAPRSACALCFELLIRADILSLGVRHV